CLTGKCECPVYQTYCGGATASCVAAVDPANCGGCGTTCGAGMYCSSGTCQTTCLPSLTACANDHSCSDLQSDNNHCGSCTTKCDATAGMGCLGGQCVKGIATGGPGPTNCAGGGPPIVNPDNLGGCIGALAATTFRWTLCSCQDVGISDTILVDAF